MTLTGLPLLVTSTAVTLALAVATGVLWWWTGRRRREGRRGVIARAVLRPLVLLLAESAAVATVAIGANRALEIYPSWSVLFGKVHTVGKAAAAPAADLEGRLRRQMKQGTDAGLVFPWKPAASGSWGLAAPPVVAVPAAYLRDADALFPVVVVVAPRHTGAWDDQHALDAARSASSAVVVFIHLDDPAIALPALTTQLPAQLGHDLRVQPANWAVTGVGADQQVALDLLQKDGDRYRTAALIDDGAAGPAASLLDRARHLPAGLDPLFVTAKPVAGGLSSQAVPQLARRLPAALRWIQQRIPPPLAAPLVDPTAPTKRPGL
jgi:hypothetical protein